MSIKKSNYLHITRNNIEKKKKKITSKLTLKNKHLLIINIIKQQAYYNQIKIIMQ